MMQTNDIYNTCLDISNVLNAGDISNARSKVITLLHEINGTNNNSYMELVNHLIREVGLLPYIDTYTASDLPKMQYIDIYCILGRSVCM